MKYDVHLLQPVSEVYVMTLSYLPVLHQSDGAIIICVVHVEQDWEDTTQVFRH